MEVEQPVAPVEPAPLPAETPAKGTGNPEGGEKEPEPEKTYTKAELIAETQRVAAKAEAKAERRAMRMYQETLAKVMPKTDPQNGKPEKSMFANEDDYHTAMVDYRIAERQHEEQGKQFVNARDKAISAAEKEEGFDKESWEDLPISTVAARTILESDIPGKLIAYLCSHPEETVKLSKLSFERQAAQLGKIEDKIASAPITTKAPSPPNVIGGKGKPVNNLATMSDEEYNKRSREARGRRVG